MTVPPDQITSDAQSCWSDATDDPSFWSAVGAWIGTAGRTAADALAYLSALRGLCDTTYAGPYSLPPPPQGPAVTTPIALLGVWAALTYGAMAPAAGSPNDNVAAGIPFVAGSGLRRDAAIDAARLAVAWSGGLDPFPSPIPQVQPTSSQGGEAMNAVEAALTIAGTLLLAVPGVGPVAGNIFQAGAQLLKFFFPGTSASPTFTSLTQALVGSMEKLEYSAAAAGLQADGNWLQGQYNILDAASDLTVSSTIPWIETNLVTPIDARINGETNTATNLAILTGYVDAPGVIELIFYGVSVWVALNRQRVVTDVLLGSFAQSENPTLDETLAQISSAVLDFTAFSQAILGAPGVTQTPYANWAAQLNAFLCRVGVERLSKITKPQSGGGSGPVSPFTGNPDTQMDELTIEFKFSDREASKGTKLPSQSYGFQTYEYLMASEAPSHIVTWRHDFIAGPWADYIAEVGGALDTLYGAHFECISTWCSSVAQWAQQLPLVAPTWAPAVGSFTAGVPNGAVWQAGAQVRYAVSYANEQGASPQGPWTDPIAVSGQSCPGLQLQPDPRGSATVYWILRQVRPPGAVTFNGTMGIGIVNVGSGPSTYVDQDVSTLGLPPPPSQETPHPS